MNDLVSESDQNLAVLRFCAQLDCLGVLVRVKRRVGLAVTMGPPAVGCMRNLVPSDLALEEQQVLMCKT